MPEEAPKQCDQHKDIVSLWKDINAEINRISEAKLTHEAQVEIAELVNLLKPMKHLGIYKPDDEHRFVLELYLSTMRSLLVETPNMHVVRETRRELQDIVKNRGPLSRWFHSTQASLKVLCGLSIALIVITLLYFVLRWSFSCIDKIEPQHITLVFWYGTIGSIVSIMIRLDGLYSTQHGSTSYYFLTGCFKPFLGVFFALFTYAVTMSQMTALKASSENLLFIIMATSFLAGFSERFAKDVTDKAVGAAFK
jgi:hypothetical protein